MRIRRIGIGLGSLDHRIKGVLNAGSSATVKHAANCSPHEKEQ